ncbi:T9SS type A sorting domain-containing protein [Ferruginibacter albus]|uniref:T9SS type A sorting domain-containing protein n=1 Tax=Ferruginibacter albus TaxID=2875540 RepID=UPI001CC47083|nr:T9SS type A sorting domain-containing protein [Ferruginibacter albus]UAY53603.1 T9SS type A sorting domain-containing protein [Ferruginibacter albus]
MKKELLLCSFAIFFSFIVSAQQIAFPGAEGFGKYSTGGRGGKLVEVTTLEDSVAGSLRWALDQYVTIDSVYKDALNPKYPITRFEPLTIVFKVSGVIHLKSDLKIKRDNLTIAGQTAPGDGICTADHSVLINGATGGEQFYWGPRRKNVIVRYMRFRSGIPRDVNGTPTSSFVTYGLDVENYENVIVDHCSISWANEECLAIYDNKNTTVQWSIISEGLYNANHPKGLRAYCGVWGGQYASYHHNLIADQASRTARFDGSRAHDTVALVDYRNNVIYNWGTSSSCYGGEVEINGGVSNVNMVNNYYKPGPATPSTLKFVQCYYTSPNPIGHWYITGNTMINSPSKTSDNWTGVDISKNPVDSQANLKSTTEFPIAIPLPLQTASDAFDSVLANAGAIRPKRDTIDRRITNEVLMGTATGSGYFGTAKGIIDDPLAVGGWPIYNTYDVPTDTDHDGMPDDWETAHSLNPNDETDRNTVDGSGYTMLEVYLNEIAIETPVPVKLVSFTGVAVNNSAAALKWTATNETNNKGWDVERTLIGSDQWQNIGFIKGSSNSSITNNYSFTDAGIISGQTYQYRLQQIDIDGKISYSNIISVRFNTDNDLNMSVYPNPVTRSTTIGYSLPFAAHIRLFVYNSQGQIVNKTADSYLQKGNYQQSINATNWPAGKYIIKLMTDGKTVSTGFIKAGK